MTRRRFGAWRGSAAAVCLLLPALAAACLDLDLDPITPAPPLTSAPTVLSQAESRANATQTRQASLGVITLPGSAGTPAPDVFPLYVFPARETSRCPGVLRAADYIELTCFPPEQELRLLVYEPGSTSRLPGRFYGEFRLAVDGEGYLKLRLNNGRGTDYEYVLINARNNRELYPAVHNCPRMSWSGLVQNQTARVNFTDGARVNLREWPASGSEGVVGKYSEGTEMKLLAGPACGEGFLWWKVNVQGQGGWMAEGDGIERYLEPWK